MNVHKRVRVGVDLSVPKDASKHEIADALLDFLCDGGDGKVPFPDAMVFSVDDVFPIE